MRQRICPPIALVMLVTVVLLVSGGIVSNDWVEFDDTINVIENPRFFPVTWDGMTAFWREPFLQLYIPLSYMLFGAECMVARASAGEGPTAPFGASLFHAVSLGIHVIVTMLVWRILARFIVRPEAVLLGAALFAWHPLQVESVAWVSEQRGLLAALFALIALDGLLVVGDRVAAKQRAEPAYAMATLAFAAALLSKPVAIMTPLVGLALLRQRGSVSAGQLSRMLVPWLAMSAAAAVVTRWAQPASLCNVYVPLAARPLVAGDALGFYVTKVMVPRDLCVGYGRTPSVVLADSWSPVVASLVGVSLIAVFTLHRLRPWRLPVALFICPLVPVLGFTQFVFQNQSTVADRYAYIAMLGPALGLGLLADHVLATARVGAVIRVAAVCAMAALAVTARRQVATWRNTGTLAAHACVTEPEVTGSWTMLASHWLESGDPRRAIVCAERALELDPQNVAAVFNIVAASARMENPTAVKAGIARLLAVGVPASEITDGFYTRGVTHLKAGRTREAIIDFEIAIGETPKHVRTLTNLGVAYTRVGDLTRAIEVLQAAVVAEPLQAAAWVGLGNAFLQEGRPAEAADSYDRALTIASDDSGTLMNRARARLKLGDTDGAASDMARAVRLGMLPDPELSALLNTARAGR